MLHDNRGAKQNWKKNIRNTSPVNVATHFQGYKYKLHVNDLVLKLQYKVNKVLNLHINIYGI